MLTEPVAIPLHLSVILCDKLPLTHTVTELDTITPVCYTEMMILWDKPLLTHTHTQTEPGAMTPVCWADMMMV